LSGALPQVHPAAAINLAETVPNRIVFASQSLGKSVWMSVKGAACQWVKTTRQLLPT